MVLEMVKVFAALLVTLAAVYLLLRLLKQKMLPHKGMIEMIYYQSFGPKKGIAVVKILNDYMAVGVGGSGHLTSEQAESGRCGRSAEITEHGKHYAEDETQMVEGERQ